MTSVFLNYYNFHEKWAFARMSKYLKAGQKCVVLPLAFRDNEVFDNETFLAYYGVGGEKYQKFVPPLLSFGISEADITVVNFFELPSDAKSIIECADVLLLTGGLPEKIFLRLQQLGLQKTVKNFSGVLIGVSAGAMVLLQNYHITPDSDYDSYCAKNEGLGRVRDFDIEVHFENTDIQRQCLKQALNDNGLPIFAVWHQGGLIVKDNAVVPFGKVDFFENEKDL